MSGQLNTRLARNAGWSFLGQGMSIFVQAAYFVVIARLLGSTNYGIYTSAYALVSIISQYSSLGSGYVFLRNVSADRNRFGEYWGNILLTTLVVGGLLVLGVTAIGRVVLTHTSATIVFCVAIGDTIGQQLVSTIGQVFQTFEKLRSMATLNLSVNVLRLCLAFGMLITIRHANAAHWAVASMIVSILASAYAVASVWRTFGSPRIKLQTAFSNLGEGFVFSVSGSTTYIYNDLDKVMLGHFGMNAANGIYSMAYRVINICTTPITAVHVAAYPRFFQLGVGGAQKTEPFARKILGKTVMIGIVGAIGMFVTAPLIPHIVGKSFSDSVSALRWLCLIPLFRCFHLSAGDAMAGAAYQNYRLVTRIIAAVVNFGLNLLLIPTYSWLGAAWASLATDGGLGALDWIVIRLVVARERRESVPGLEFA